MSISRSSFEDDSLLERQERRVGSAPNGSRIPFSIATVSENSVGSNASTIKNFNLALMPENVDSVVKPAIDMRKFCQLLLENPSLLNSPQKVLHHLRSAVIDPDVISFSNILPRHLEVLGMDYTGALTYDNDWVQKANFHDSPANVALQKSGYQRMRAHLNLSASIKSGARWLIDQYILAAVTYAQDIFDNDEQLKQEMDHKYRIDAPLIAVFPGLPIPFTTITCGNNSHTFHGVLDYGIGFISNAGQPALASGGAHLDPSHALFAIVEAKGGEKFELQDLSRIATQLLTCLVLTKQTSFSGALTNGVFWRFFTAHDGGNQLRIYSCGDFRAEVYGGTIIEFLKDMILYGKSPMVTADFTKEFMSA
ncbi:hypothetical protein BU17DRAFT_99676 [Hysterangium stoloniferum]|nr:hypothetical protein BU17DRAFT_99676 [Hysterangium stoloniferum]